MHICRSQLSYLSKRNFFVPAAIFLAGLIVMLDLMGKQFYQAISYQHAYKFLSFYCYCVQATPECIANLPDFQPT